MVWIGVGWDLERVRAFTRMFSRCGGVVLWLEETIVLSVEFLCCEESWLIIWFFFCIWFSSDCFCFFLANWVCSFILGSYSFMFYALVAHFMGIHCFEQNREFFWGVSVCVVVESWGMWSQKTRWVFHAFFFQFWSDVEGIYQSCACKCFYIYNVCNQIAIWQYFLHIV